MKRQGDILLVPVKDLPDGLKEVPRQNGRIVLAEGEVTGHFHAIEAEEVTFHAKSLEEVEGRFLVIEAEAITAEAVYEQRKTGRTITPEPYYDEEIGATVTPDAYEETERIKVGEREVPGVTLDHPEHDTVVLAPGNYEVRRQREYSEAGGINLVAD
jgi:hypothetical protein